MSNEDFKPVKVTGIGVRIGVKNKKLRGIIQVDENGESFGEIALYEEKVLRGFNIGCIYEIQATIEEGEIQTVRPSTKRFIGEFLDSDKIVEWQVQHDSAVTEYSRKQKETKAAKGKEVVLDCLEPLRRAYMNTNHDGRLALEVRVLNYLRNGSGL